MAGSEFRIEASGKDPLRQQIAYGCGNHVKQHLWNAKHFTREMEKAYEEMW